MNIFVPMNIVNLQAKPEVSDRKKDIPSERKKSVLSAHKSKPFSAHNDSKEKNSSQQDEQDNFCQQSENSENAVEKSEFQTSSKEDSNTWNVFHEHELVGEFFHQEKLKSEENLLQNLFESLCSNVFEGDQKLAQEQNSIKNPKKELLIQCISKIVQSIDFKNAIQSPIPTYHQPYEEIPHKLYRNWMGLPLLFIDIKNFYIENSLPFIMLIDFERKEYYLVLHSDEDKKKRQYFGAFSFTIDESFSEITTYSFDELLSLI